MLDWSLSWEVPQALKMITKVLKKSNISESILSRASQRPMLQVNDQPSGGRSHLCNADRHAKYKTLNTQCKKMQNTKHKKQKHKMQNTE